METVGGCPGLLEAIREGFVWLVRCVIYRWVDQVTGGRHRCILGPIQVLGVGRAEGGGLSDTLSHLSSTGQYWSLWLC